VVTPDDAALRQSAYDAVAAVVDPEIPALTIVDLGILRDVSVHDGTVAVTITPTYIGCPAMAIIQQDVEAALTRAGIRKAEVRTVLSPAWTTNWLSETARAKLAAAGIAPPSQKPPACPRCGSEATEPISAFGSTACKALYRCRGCREPFETFKCH
jgi:ring-1,2-phenylacetyl-CoA epoxidase subunit PaaD